MKASLALGNFDGVHKAHGKLIEKLNTLPGEHIVYMFDRHPKEILDNGFKTLMTADMKRDTLLDLGADKVYFEKLTKEILDTPPESFVRDILVKKFSPCAVVAGFNYRFGAKAEGNADLLRKLGKKYGFEVYIADEYKVEGKTLSSTMLRWLLKEGEIEKYNKYSEKPYRLRGKIIRGKRLGHKLGFPTINIEFSDSVIIPRNGVYAGNVLINGIIHRCVTNIGSNPTVEKTKVRAESHIIDFNGELYGEQAEIILLSFIRDEQKFNDIDELKKQIMLDKQYAERIEQ